MSSWPVPENLDNFSFLPKREEIPQQFFRRENQWRKILSDAFFGNLPDNTTYIPKPGFNTGKSLRVINRIMESMDLEHNYKLAACAFLLSEWFEDVR